MKGRIIAASIFGGFLILILSVWIGFNSARRSPAPIEPHDLPEPASTEAVFQTEIAETQVVYTILLEGGELTMISDGEVIKKTEISPDVFPVADIKALQSGVQYSSLEDALMDWESLSD